MLTYFGYKADPATSPWWYVLGGTADDVTSALQEHGGAQLTNLSAYIDNNGALRFTALMEPASTAWWWYAGRTAEQVGQLLQQNSAMLTIIRIYVDVDNSFKFVVNMVPADRAWWWYVGQTGAQVQKLLEQNSARLTDVCAYSDSSRVDKFAVIMDSTLGYVSPSIGAGLKIDELIPNMAIYFNLNYRLTRISPYHLVPATGGYSY